MLDNKIINKKKALKKGHNHKLKKHKQFLNVCAKSTTEIQNQ